MLSYRLGTINDFNWGLNQFLAIANVAVSQHLMKKNKKKKIYSRYPGYLEYNENEVPITESDTRTA